MIPHFKITEGWEIGLALDWRYISKGYWSANAAKIYRSHLSLSFTFSLELRFTASSSFPIGSVGSSCFFSVSLHFVSLHFILLFCIKIANFSEEETKPRLGYLSSAM